MALLILVANPVWQNEPIVQEAIQLVGTALVIGAVLGRLWSALYIGGRKNAKLIMNGPYSITRNPLYFFSAVGSVGAGLAFGSLVLGSLAGAVVSAVLYATSRGEAVLLHSRFGCSYEKYAEQVPLFWPQPCLYEEARDTTFHPQALKRALADAILFLLVIPVAEVVDLLRSLDVLPQLITLF